MDIIPYNSNYAVKPNGFVNIGNLCYCNSLLQCILSCTSIFEVLEKNKNKSHIRKNPFAQTILELYNWSASGKDVGNRNVAIWGSLIAMSLKRKDNVKFDSGQQDAHEGLMFFLNELDTIPELKRLFEHRHRTQILCNVCKQWVVDKSETNLVFEVQPDLKTEQHEKFKDIDDYYNTSLPLNEFLRKQNGYVDEDYVCPNPECKAKGHKFKTTTLTMIPEILPVTLKKYNHKVLTPFPSKLEFIAKGKGKKLIYKLVAQSEHAGSQGGGHYWAVALRKNTDEKTSEWYNLNDNSYCVTQPGPTLNSYLLFYHYDGCEDYTPTTDQFVIIDQTNNLDKDLDVEVIDLTGS